MSSARPDDDLVPSGGDHGADPVGLLDADESWEETLQRVAALGCATLPGCAACSVTLWREDQPYTVVSTDDLARAVDEAQYELLEGPCLDASRYGEAYVVSDMTAEQRWPVFASMAVRRGVHASMSLPLTVRGDAIGALNLYATERGAFAGAEDTARTFARQAGVAIANAQVYGESRRLAEQLQEAMSSRAVIEQAKGVLMAEQGCGPDEAFELLRVASQRENVKIRDIAQRIVTEQVTRKR